MSSRRKSPIIVLLTLKNAVILTFAVLLALGCFLERRVARCWSVSLGFLRYAPCGYTENRSLPMPESCMDLGGGVPPPF